jgi:hypothetical protein
MLITVTGRKTGKSTLRRRLLPDGEFLWVVSSRDRTW